MPTLEDVFLNVGSVRMEEEEILKSGKIDEAENTTLYSENLKPHNLRHSFAIEALKTNEINYVKEFLGHENIQTTQIYTDLKEKEVLED